MSQILDAVKTCARQLVSSGKVESIVSRFRNSIEATVVDFPNNTSLLVLFADGRLNRSNIRQTSEVEEVFFDVFESNDKTVLGYMVVSKNVRNTTGVYPLFMWTDTSVNAIALYSCALSTWRRLIEPKDPNESLKNFFERLRKVNAFEDIGFNRIAIVYPSGGADVEIPVARVCLDRETRTRTVEASSEFLASVGEAAHDFYTILTRTQLEHTVQINDMMKNVGNFRNPSEVLHEVMSERSHSVDAQSSYENA